MRKLLDSTFNRHMSNVNYDILFVYKNQPKLSSIMCSPNSSPLLDLHAVAQNSGKLNASTKFRVSHYRARFTLPAVTAN